MEPDFYQVQVLHYLNPHLIWVEVLKDDDNYVFEQVGIYGLLPLDTSIDIVGNLQTRRCTEWKPAAVVLMKKLLVEAKEVWFQSTFIDRRSSIFDNNLHKYGDMIVKKSNGKMKSLITYLADSGFALQDVPLFHQELSSGNVKSKLDRNKTKEVIKQLTNFYNRKENAALYEKSVKQQTSISHKADKLESVLTKRNLDKHNRENCEQLLQNKLRDLDLCKGVEEESLGRAISCKKSKSQSSPSHSIKLEQKKNQAKNKDSRALDVFYMTKKILEDNAVSNLGDFPDANKSPDGPCYNLFPSKLSTNYKDTEAERSVTEKENAVPVESQTYQNNISNPLPSVPTSHARVSKLKRFSQKSAKLPEYDSKTEKIVAYGPPDINKTKLALKIVRIEDFDAQLPEAATIPQDEDIDDEVHKNDMFDDVDSNIDFEINNLNHLKMTKDDKSADRTTTFVESNEDIDVDHKFDQKCEILKLEKPYFASTDQKPLSELERKVIESDKWFESDGNDKMDEHCKFDSETKQVHKDDSSENYNVKTTTSKPTKKSILFQRYRKIYSMKKQSNSTSNSDTTNKDTSSECNLKTECDIDTDTESISGIIEQVNATSNYVSPKTQENDNTPVLTNIEYLKANVNPFKNVERSKSVFVDKLVSPVLMVHTKKNNRIQPTCNLRDLSFGPNIQVALKNMNVKEPTRIQTVSWPTILRGHSVFIISPMNSGKTMGYLPAVCRLVTDQSRKSEGGGPSCIIICATARSVSDVEHLARMFVGLDEKVLALYSGMDEMSITTSLLNGCDLLICTAPMLVRLLQVGLGVDLKRLATFVLDDCERLSIVYLNEIKICIYKIKEMLKNRANKESKVQFVVSSRIWCKFMEPLALKTPDTVICVGAFQECVLYSKANTTVRFVMKENKINSVLEFLQDIDGSKKTVIVCRDDDEVEQLDKVLTGLKYVVFACNGTMTLHDLYNMNVAFTDYQEPLLGPILICCDGNLTHLNVTDAHYLVQYSMPHLFSQFCKRFSVLNDNYASIFKVQNENVKINILLEESNVEQLPKILNFVNRCGYKTPEQLDTLCKKILAQKDVMKAKKFVPLCDNLLAFGECPNFWNCEERHSIIREFDTPSDRIPKHGIVTFKILHYHSAVSYSVRLLSNILDGQVKKYPQTSLSLKMGMYYSKLANQQLHGFPKVGDICAVSLKMNFHARCQVLKILNCYPRGNPNYVLIKLLDEEKLEKTRDIYLYHLPDELKKIDSHVVQVRLANIQPQDKDITYTDLAKDLLKRVTDNDDKLYARGKIALTVGNCIFVDTLEACQDLSSMNETVIKHNFKKDLLDGHAISKCGHIKMLKYHCKGLDLGLSQDSSEDELGDHDSEESDRTQNVRVQDMCTKENKIIEAVENTEDNMDLQSNSHEDRSGSDDMVLQQYKNSMEGYLDDKSKGGLSDVDSVCDIDAELQLKNETLHVDYENRNEIAEIEREPNKKAYTEEIKENIEPLFNKQIDLENETPCSSIKSATKAKEPKKTQKHKSVIKSAVEPSWSYLDTEDFCEVFFSCAESPSKFFVRMSKYEQCISYLLEDIKQYVKENSDRVTSVSEGDIVIAKFPDDSTYERARIDELIDKKKVKCFFVDQGDWRDVYVEELLPISEKLVKKIPFQAIECRLLGVKPVGDEWTEFCTNWFCDKCLVDDLKYMYLKYLKQETAESTGGYKYAVIVVDTNSDKDIILNKLIVEANLAVENDEMELVNSCNLNSSDESDDKLTSKNLVPYNQAPSESLLLRQPIRSVPLFEDSQSEDDWSLNMSDDEMMSAVKPICQSLNQNNENNIKELSAPGSYAKIKEILKDTEIQDDEGEAENYTERKDEAQNNIEINNVAKIEKEAQNSVTKEEEAPNNVESNLTMQHPVDELSKPKLVWRQTKSNVFIKIHLIGVENYNLTIDDRSLDLSATLNDLKYGFKLNLYGVVDTEKCSHSSKGLYILVNLVKVLKTNWLSLTKGDWTKNWIKYDVDSISVSSEEECEVDDSVLELIKNNHNENLDSDDEDFQDDTATSYNR